MASTLTTFCTSNIIHWCKKDGPSYSTSFLGVGHRILDQSTSRGSQKHHNYEQKKSSYKFSVYAVTKGSAKSNKSEENMPSWAKPDSDEPPPWAREEGQKDTTEKAFEIPFFVYLLASAVTAIAAVGSVFEYVNQKPIFGLLGSDSIFYAPLLGFFAFTGIPTSAFLWFKSVQVANKEAEEQDRRDGYM